LTTPSLARVKRVRCAFGQLAEDRADGGRWTAWNKSEADAKTTPR